MVRELGAGGMATVYLAHDLKHERDVAIKVLHPDLGAALGAERFLAEIKTTAKLQHPHILPLLDSGAADGLLYYVMPYVKGETLRGRLTRERQLSLDDALRVAREVADALHHAHGLGVIHRDIKPENILLQEGHALVADFGIALAVQTAGGARMTQTGLSLGTPQYMSPEQAMGERAIDARTDLYALGAVTYEMLCGEPPFTGASVQSIVAKVLTEKPVALTALRDTIPPGVEQAVLCALAKLPADRFASAAAFADALQRSSLTGAAGDALRAADRGRAVRHRPRGGREAGHRPRRPHHRLCGRHRHQRRVVRPSARRADPRLLPGTENARAPFFSPDGRWIGFVARGRLRKVPAAGGAVSVVGRRDPADLGEVAGPILAPDGRTVVAIWVTSRIRAGSVTPLCLVEPDGRVTRLDIGAVRPLGFVDDHLIFLRSDGTIMAVPLDLRARAFTGPPVALLESVSSPALSSSGSLLYSPGQPASTAVLVDARGAATPLLGEARQYGNPRYSPDGRRVAFDVGSAKGRDIWIYELASATFTRLTSTGSNVRPEWSPDGRRVLYRQVAPRKGLWWQPADGSGAPELLAEVPGGPNEGVVSADGRNLLYRTDEGTGDQQVFSMPLDKSAPPTALITKGVNWAPRFSPNGRWIAYSSDESGTAEVYVRPFPGAAGRVQVSNNGGSEPV